MSQSLVPAPEKPKLPAQASGASTAVRMSSRQSRHLAQAIVLEESGTNPLVRFTMLVACLASLAFLLWAGLTQVNEVAMAEGQIVPTGSIQQVQHLEGGIVQEVLAKDGTLVEAGQPIIKLNPAQALADLEQSRAREAALLLRAERLRAFAEERQPDMSFIGPGYERLVADNMSIYKTQAQARDTSRAVLMSQIDQKRSDLKMIEAQQKTLQEQIHSLGEELHMREELLSKGLVSRIVFLDNKREHSRVQGELARIVAQAVTARESLAEAENRLVDAQSTLYKQTMDDLGSVIGELAQVQESLGRLEDRVQRVVVTAPTRGVVKGLAVKNPGAVIQPGGMVCEIVPEDGMLKAEGKVQPRDVGHLHVGQPVKVKITTYDYARYGYIPGTLEYISASSFVDEKGEAYFKVGVALERNWVGREPGKYLASPGMTVQSEIITGDKTLLQYLLKPIFSSLQQAFHER
jgi:HlyD family secretion protein/adhesin transport system membrane fusion protein